MIPTSRGWFNTLQLGLVVSTIGWGISFCFTFSSWEAASNQLGAMGLGVIEYRPLLDYWLRMASSVFGCIGIASFLACVRPQKYVSLIRLLGPFHFIIGLTLAIAAQQNHLDPSVHVSFIPDITFCTLAGVLIQLPLLVGNREQAKVHDT